MHVEWPNVGSMQDVKRDSIHINVFALMAILEILQLNVIHVGLKDHAILLIFKCSIFCTFPVLLFQRKVCQQRKD